ncbi:hypothetical protein DY000_02062002 [Brassica cretica]|uniref:Secreted protein n=1 Tax=Brassica cretica TaxID=69181 RepID=A0ABQ7B3B4_BRACR|nr:hypothetical protein DY000_02062002 [Brassica cretica]
MKASRLASCLSTLLQGDCSSHLVCGPLSCSWCPMSPDLSNKLDTQAAHSLVVYLWRVSYPSVCSFYSRSQWIVLETTIFGSALRMMASSRMVLSHAVGGLLCWMFRVCLCLDLGLVQVLVEWSKAAKAVVSRFKGVFLSVARGA